MLKQVLNDYGSFALFEGALYAFEKSHLSLREWWRNAIAVLRRCLGE
jgi:hypothetical protein